MKKYYKKNSLLRRLKSYTFHSLLPFSILVLLLVSFLLYIGNSYNQIVLNITTANQNILTFRHDVDYALYRTVIGSANSWGDSFDKETKDPYITISKMRGNMVTLRGLTNDSDNKKRLDNIITRLDNLASMADTIKQRVKEKGHYDENMEFLELNVYILTELITEQVHEYVYYEAAYLELVRQKLIDTVILMVCLTILCYIIITLRLRWISKSIEKSVLTPITEMSRATKEIGKGEFIIIEDKHYDDEVAILATSINNMSTEIKRLLEKTKIEQEQIRLTELQLYQSQINPHFLYNTLDNIVALVESRRPQDAVMLIERLSDFFRTSLSGGRSKISIGEEIQQVTSYLEIQSVRYQDIMEYKIDVDPSLLQYQMIKLTLQPLVENALYHGIKMRRGLGHIVVKGTLDHDTILFTVSDDGIGMKKEKLEELRKSIENPKKCSSLTFGFHNVNQRLVLNYGPKFKLEIDSQLNKGTIIKVHIPLETL